MTDLRLYGLLHLAESESTATNVRVHSFDDQIRVYALNALGLARSLQAQGVDFTLLTNDRARVQSGLVGDPDELVVEEIPFAVEIPSGIGFYSTHFKFDVYSHLARLTHGYVGYCDLDALCLREVPPALAQMIRSRTPVCYDITDQMAPACGADALAADLALLTGGRSTGRWTGGEFIAGPPTFFASLVRAADEVWPVYREVYPSLRHVSDETVVSPAIEILRSEGVAIADAGALHIVGRFWNLPVRHRQPPLSEFENDFLLHLPADKRYLASLAESGASAGPDLFTHYRRHCGRWASRRRRILMRVRSHLRRLPSRRGNPAT